MKNKNVTLRVDDESKKQADTIFAKLGLRLSTTFNIFLRKAVREQQIPFQISQNIPNATTLAAMDDAECGNNLYGPFDNMADLMEALNT